MLIDTEATGNLPFKHFHASIPENPTPSDLLEMYYSLYQRARAAEHRFTGRDVDPGPLHRMAATISYNLAMTTTTMAICPRRSEGASLSDDRLFGKVALNGTILAGTLMVKSEDDWNQLCQDPGLLGNLLRSGGIPAPVSILSSNENSLLAES